MTTSSTAPLTVAVVARRLGLAPATLRTWARRYGLGPSAHEEGSHRRYTPEDVARLEAVRRLVLEGVPPAEAARTVTGQPLVPSAGEGELPGADGRLSPARGGPGGRVLAMPGADAVVRGLGRAAMALDAPTVVGTIRSQLDEHGVLHTWEHVLRPVLASVGARWASTGEGVEVEHLLSDCVVTALRESTLVREVRETRTVLLACAPDDQHVLPLHAVAAGLAERGVGSRVLGASLPGTALEAAVRRTGPAAVLVWAQLPSTADTAVLERLPVTRPATALLAAGPGWDPDALPDRVSLVQDLPSALELVGRALGR